MRKYHIKISEDEYYEYYCKTPKEIKEFIISKIPLYIFCGYGFYGGGLREDNGKYYITIDIGDSCD